MSTPALKIYNTLTRTKEAFEPIDRNNVRMYVCGPTVYDYAHIGNARPLIVFDVLYRLLRHLYGESHVKYVRNITDVDDKINARAAQRGITIRELTEETNKVFQEDVRALGCLEPDVQPRATEHIAQMIAIIERLIASGHAYAADGHVLFDVPSMPAYGRLSRRSLDEMLAGARVDVAPYKRGDMDFVLWKPSKEGEPGWESPWGRGRPGWHIECSAMSWKHLGETFDIHGGGIDLVFPHHENEIAQSCCAFGQDVMANYWMHNGFLQVEGEKMSKSLGNFITIRELLRSYHGNVVRLTMLKTHYRQPIDWTRTEMEASERELAAWTHAIEYQGINPNLVSGLGELTDEACIVALSDDLNTPETVTRLRELGKAAEQHHSAAMKLFATLNFMGFRDLHKSGFYTRALASYSDFVATNEGYFDMILFRNLTANNVIAELSGLTSKLKSQGVTLTVDQTGRPEVVSFSSEKSRIESLIASRLAARAAKNWAESDRIRDELAAMGIALKDNKDGTTSWEVKR
ncbi:cysteine--tRNA ligase [Methylocystis sp. JR02]|uniref:cysteine--tRNA ligase n=1 Tax=Methylocystis sp. JR02 TaxID=3046284 RepID=UPI0024BB2261|nr:cysteine--tRNA ligase [Methylocystis sp. JR02]MDJ0448389.1 cysteine--tRNA ligase [Methylocystis sp. JR02]